MFSDSDGFPIWRKTLLPDPAVSGGVDYLVFTQGSSTASSILVAETLQSPSQSGTAQTVMPVTIAETLLKPVQSLTAQTVMPVIVSELTLTPEQAATAGTSINVIISETLLTPVQSILAETAGGKKNKNSPWAYYPPILTIRTKGSQEVPPPSQQAFAKFTRKVEVKPVIIEKKAVFIAQGMQFIPAPYQTIKAKSHRDIKAMQREEQDILTLLASL